MEFLLMNKWLAGLIIVAVGLPLLMFAGNLNSDASEAERADAAVQVEPATGSYNNNASSVSPQQAVGNNASEVVAEKEE